MIKKSRQKLDDVATTSLSATTSFIVPDFAATTVSDDASTSTSTGAASPIRLLYQIDPQSFRPIWIKGEVAPRTYPNVEATLALTYPPGYLFKNEKFVKGVKMSYNFSREVALHGRFEPPHTKTVRVKSKKGKGMKTKKVSKQQSSFDEAFAERLHAAMPHVGASKCQEMMVDERNKHGEALNKFLTYDTAVDDNASQFFQGVGTPWFRHFKFSNGFIKRLSKAMPYVDNLRAQEIIDLERRKHGENSPFFLRFIIAELKQRQICVWEYSFLGEDWIDIRLEDLAAVCESYGSLCSTNAEKKLTFRLDEIPKANYYFLYEVQVEVTEDGDLLAAGPMARVFEDYEEGSNRNEEVEQGEEEEEAGGSKHQEKCPMYGNITRKCPSQINQGIFVVYARFAVT
ncbi:hypothetical protein KSS87_017411 [Heliosperma pusillum]|nr:hypothetical protein KSS87_017411 [Heliosperma pusillum]